ncbi:MAG: fibronectin type III domain-containing protein [Sedimentisphaerales bacterium]|jgi:hypothetical protein
MTKFPKSEPQIMALVYRMVAGFAMHPADFPRIPFLIRIKLLNAGRSYLFAKKDLVEANAKLRIATKAKNEMLLELINIMKASLQKAQVDVSANPEKLKLIGWEPKTAYQPTQIPGQPTNLVAVHKQDGVVDLNWKKPADGGIVYNYIIERRCLDANQSDNWTLEAISYTCQVNLPSQPKDIKLEYRVKASNLAGQSIPSNAVTITL